MKQKRFQILRHCSLNCSLYKNILKNTPFIEVRFYKRFPFILKLKEKKNHRQYIVTVSIGQYSVLDKEPYYYIG